ncbi:UV DNA damage repair endonuclease UvsE [Texcoconibacillus texcoconensis]|uniref:UV DNA damage endonuclease n=1 Tax=Texcoconibacillus texcoconensis TaxID=1095777 RepID=A0A840QTH5_9BACI|nr:UV DNA damage repair endonuclease UvsE [Texcoconibacillus texcoconensis]MBB5174608.1 UV DNA damage endonuclease [Texcoconibacillus texcoconensis]
MILRFGYVSTALALWEATPSRTLTYTNWSKLDKTTRTEKLHAATEENLNNTLRALHYNIAHGIHLYRMSSALVPLATHPEVKWDYITPFRHLFQEIGELVKRHNLRVSFHPDQFTLFTSPKPHVTDNSLTNMAYHYDMLEAMDLHKSAIINIHIGGAYGNKQETLIRFNDNISKLDPTIRQQMTLENDDKTYTADETLHACERHNIPFVFDYHHHQANLGTTNLEDLLPRIFATWEHTNQRPKFHLSSPKSKNEYRAHAQYIDQDFAQPFIKTLKTYGQSADIMIEAKAKDLAALKFVEDLSKTRGYKRIDGATIKM